MLVLILLVAASNIASLVSARTWSRSFELAVRTALGASRSRVVGQLFVEVAILSAIGSSQVLATVAGSALAYVAAGATIGTIVGVMLAGFQSVMLIRMPGVGVATPTIVIGALALSSLAAAWVPTRRALSIRPSEALAAQ